MAFFVRAFSLYRFGCSCFFAGRFFCEGFAYDIDEPFEQHAAVGGLRAEFGRHHSQDALFVDSRFEALLQSRLLMIR